MKSVSDIFDDLDRYRKFCVEFGYRFNETDLYGTRANSPYTTFLKQQAGEMVINGWARDKEMWLKRQAEKRHRPNNNRNRHNNYKRG